MTMRVMLTFLRHEMKRRDVFKLIIELYTKTAQTEVPFMAKSLIITQSVFIES